MGNNSRRRFPHGRHATGDKTPAPQGGANGSLKKNRSSKLKLQDTGEIPEQSVRLLLDLDPAGNGGVSAGPATSRALTFLAHQWDDNWNPAAGIDNLNNDKYFLFHPFPQRTAVMEIHYMQ